MNDDVIDIGIKLDLEDKDLVSLQKQLDAIKKQYESIFNKKSLDSDKVMDTKKFNELSDALANINNSIVDMKAAWAAMENKTPVQIMGELEKKIDNAKRALQETEEREESLTKEVKKLDSWTKQLTTDNKYLKSLSDEMLAVGQKRREAQELETANIEKAKEADLRRTQIAKELAEETKKRISNGEKSRSVREKELALEKQVAKAEADAAKAQAKIASDSIAKYDKEFDSIQSKIDLRRSERKEVAAEYNAEANMLRKSLNSEKEKSKELRNSIQALEEQYAYVEKVANADKFTAEGAKLIADYEKQAAEDRKIYSTIVSESSENLKENMKIADSSLGIEREYADETRRVSQMTEMVNSRMKELTNSFREQYNEYKKENEASYEQLTSEQKKNLLLEEEQSLDKEILDIRRQLASVEAALAGAKSAPDESQEAQLLVQEEESLRQQLKNRLSMFKAQKQNILAEQQILNTQIKESEAAIKPYLAEENRVKLNQAMTSTFAERYNRQKAEGDLAYEDLDYEQKKEKILQEQTSVKAKILEIQRRIASLNQQIAASKEDENNKDSLSARVLREQADAEKEKLKTSMATLHAYNQNLDAERKMLDIEYESEGANKKNADGIYYALRAVKMARFELNTMMSDLNNLIKNLTSLGRKLASVFFSLLIPLRMMPALFVSSAKILGQFPKLFKRTTNESKKLNSSLNFGFLTILKYSLGIRSLYTLMGKLRSWTVDGFKNMAMAVSEVDKQISSLWNNFRTMKNMMAAMVQPLLNILVPAFDKLAAYVEKATIAIGSFFAALSGQTFVYKAAKVTGSWAESLSNSAKSAKKLKKELSGLDKLNVLNSKDKNDKNKDKSKGSNGGFTPIPIDPKILDLVEKLKNLLKDLFEPLKKAWDKVKDYVLQSFKDMVDKMKALLSDIFRDFMKVWKQPETEKIFENLLRILGNIFTIIGNIAEGWRKAWNANNNGLRILEAIRDIILIITNDLVRLTDFLVDWTAGLDWVPLFTAIADVLQKQVVPAVYNISGLITDIVIDIIDVLGTYMIEKGLPKIVHLIGNIVEAIGNIAGKFREAWNSASTGRSILEGIRDILDIIITDALEISRHFANWTRNITLKPLLSEIAGVMNQQIVPAISNISGLMKDVFKDIVDVIGTYLVQEGLPKMVSIIGNIVESVGNIAGRFREAWNQANTGKGILQEIKNIIDIILTGIQSASEKTAEWSSKLDFGPLLKDIKQFLDDMQGPLQVIVDLAVYFYENVVLKFFKFLLEDENGFRGLLKVLQDVSKAIDWDKLKERMQDFMDAFEKFLELGWKTFLAILKDLGERLAEFVSSDTFGWLINKFKEFTKQDPEKLAKKIEKFVAILILLKGALTGLNIMSKFAEEFLTIINLFKEIKKLDIASKFNSLKTTISNTIPKLGNFVDKLKNLESISKTAGSPLKTTLGGIGITLVGLVTNVSGFSDALQNGFTVGNESAMILGTTIAGIGLVIAGAPAVVAAALAGVLVVFENIFVAIYKYPEEFAKKINSIGDAFANLVPNLKKWWDSKVIPMFENAGKKLGEKAAKIVTTIITAFQDFPKQFEKWFKTVDWPKLGLDIIKGILNIFLLPEKLAVWLLKAIAAFFKGFVDGFRKEFDMHSPSKKMEPLGEDILKGILAGIVSAIKGIGTWIYDNVAKPFIDGVKGAFDKAKGFVDSGKKLISKIHDGIKNKMSGAKKWIFDNIVRPFVSGVADKVHKAKEFAESGKKMIDDIHSGTKDRWSKVKEKVTKLWESIKNTSKSTLERGKQFLKNGQNIIKGLYDGIKNKWKEAKPKIEENWKTLKEKAKTALTATSLLSTGTKVITGLWKGLRDKWREVFPQLNQKWRDLKDRAKSSMNDNTLASVGRQLISGLWRGIKEKWMVVKEQINNIWKSITSKAKDILKIKSPSKVFQEIGMYVIEGFEKGIDKESSKAEDDIQDAMNGLIPTEDSMQMFYENFISMLQELSHNAVPIISDMIEQIDERLSELDALGGVSRLMTSFNKMSDIRIPDIAAGKINPTSATVITIDEEDKWMNKMPAVLKNAFLEALQESTLTTGENNDIIIEIDGTRVFTVIRKENEIYKKRYGQSAFA